MQPSSQHRSVWKRAGLARQVGKDLLGNILRQVRGPIGLTQRRGIDQGKIPRNKLAESGFRTACVSTQKLLVVEHLFSQLYSRRQNKPDTKNASCAPLHSATCHK